ncbi:hypothetical protein OEZ86_014575 [Tetradesmus obliquus]|uniref:YEATS domain-containing protein n=1 Tax=Tetradesmus obliquus TaxID=3088 RepID=A0ABY8UBK7_TETOB|nr:hypothetical protein OEZ85_014305 [Tetradesmus obliquus]WIA37681.1 hypothetical protein OEZ86_014575 [Tetradesmus obliquus]
MMQPGRLQNTELVVPIIVGTVSQHLGKKQANDLASHRWTVYVRGNGNEDISHLVQRVTFNLHPSFKDPVRKVEQQPFELTETGWGEFDIGVVLHFTPDAQEKDLEVFHRLKLYADDDPTGQSRKPVVHEQWEEVVFVNPQQAFYQRIMAHQPRARIPLSIEGYLTPPSEAADLAAIQEARRKVAQMSANIRAQLQQHAMDSPGGMHHM